MGIRSAFARTQLTVSMFIVHYFICSRFMFAHEIGGPYPQAQVNLSSTGLCALWIKPPIQLRAVWVSPCVPLRRAAKSSPKGACWGNNHALPTETIRCLLQPFCVPPYSYPERTLLCWLHAFLQKSLKRHVCACQVHRKYSGASGFGRDANTAYARHACCVMRTRMSCRSPPIVS